MTLYYDIFYLDPTDTFNTLEWKNLVYWDFIFHLGPTEHVVKLMKITRNQGCLGSSKSYDPADPEQAQKPLKDSNHFEQLES